MPRVTLQITPILKLAKSVDHRMCIYNASHTSRTAAAKGESLKVLAEEVKCSWQAKVIDTQQESPHATSKVGIDLQRALKTAQKESRIIVGVPAAVKFLAAIPEDTLFCILAPPQMGDSAAHIHQVLLKAFCFENDIYIIQVSGLKLSLESQFNEFKSLEYFQVDSAEKLGRLLNMECLETSVLVQKSRVDASSEEILSPAEDAIIDFCEENWEAPKQPVVQLPNMT